MRTLKKVIFKSLQDAFAFNIAKIDSSQTTPLTSDNAFGPSPDPPIEDHQNTDAVPRYMLNEAEYIRTFGLSH